MNKQVLGGIAGAAALALIVAVITRPVEKRKGTPVDRSKPAIEAVGNTAKAPAQSAAHTKPAAPTDIVFIPEAAATNPYSNRPRPTTQRRPNATGNKRVVAARAITTKQQGEFVAPRWSPDGLELLVSKPGYGGVYTTGAEGGAIAQLSDKEGIGFAAQWEKDGSVKTRSLDGTSQKINADGSPATDPSAESDAQRTGAFSKDDVLYYRQAPGAAPQVISAGEDKYFGGVVSPDGQYIAYQGLLTGVYVQKLDGSEAPISLGRGNAPTWSPDSSGVVYSIAEDDGHNLVSGDIYYASRDGQNVSNLTQTNQAIEQNATISPDGRRIAYESDGVIYVGSLQ